MYRAYKFRLYPDNEQKILINKTFGSARFIYNYYKLSQTCSVCDNIDKKYKNVNERVYTCHKCSNTMDRDLNASINIMFEGLKLYMKEVYG